MTTYAVGDSHENCEQWAAAGECDKNPNYMRQHCAKACEQYELIDYSPIDGVESFFDLKASDIDGNLMYFEQFRGRVTIVVNVASFCGKFSDFILFPGNGSNKFIHIYFDTTSMNITMSDDIFSYSDFDEFFLSPLLRLY